MAKRTIRTGEYFDIVRSGRFYIVMSKDGARMTMRNTLEQIIEECEKFTNNIINVLIEYGNSKEYKTERGFL